MKRSRILVVDDEPGIRRAIGDFLDTKDMDTQEAADLVELRSALRSGQPDAIVLDYRLPDGLSIDIVPEIKAVHPNVPIIILTGHGTIDLAVTAIKAGADQFMTKPVDLNALHTMLQRSLGSRKVQKRDAMRSSRRASRIVDPFTGTSDAILRLCREAERVAATDRPVLVEGETGSGKGVLARWIHTAGPRADELMVDLNCAAFARELVDSELFGHERGAFTGAVAAKQGLFEIADGGTLFLDEVGDMDLALQAKLLKAVEEKRFRRVGDLHDRTSDVRLIAATHHDLAELARQEKFRRDLFFRISTIRLQVPPLRARREDVPLLARTFLQRLGAEMGRPEMAIDDQALTALQQYSWPGNVRELRNVMERALLACDSKTISARDLKFDYLAGAAGGDTLADAERAHVRRIVAEEGGDVDRAAARLGIARSTLYQKLKKYGEENALEPAGKS